MANSIQKRQRYHLILSRDIDDQKTYILFSPEAHLASPNQKW